MVCFCWASDYVPLMISCFPRCCFVGLLGVVLFACFCFGLLGWLTRVLRVCMGLLIMIWIVYVEFCKFGCLCL